MTQAGTSFYTRQTYFPYGAQRTTEGSALPTDYTFTGQKNDASADLMFYGARYYDVSLGRFTQPDTIVPSPLNPQSLNRFSYTLNNPVRYIDPSGHVPTCEDDPACGDGDPNTGAGTGGEDDPNVQPPAEPPYCEQYPEQCMTPPADTGGGQGGEDGDCNVAKCEKESSSQSHKTPVANCPLGKFCVDPDSTYSYGFVVGGIHWVGGGGWDIVADWDNDQIGLFQWGIHPFPAVLTPQIGLSAQKGELWGLDTLQDYAGDFDVTGGSYNVFTGNYIQSPDQKVQGLEVGFSVGTPEVHYYKTHADYPPPDRIWTLPHWLTPFIRQVFQ